MVVEIENFGAVIEPKNGINPKRTHTIYALDEMGAKVRLYFIEDCFSVFNEEKLLKEALKPGFQYNFNSYTVRKDGGLIFTFSDLSEITPLRYQEETVKTADGVFTGVNPEGDRVFWTPEKKGEFTQFLSPEFDRESLNKLDRGDEITVTFTEWAKWTCEPIFTHRNGWRYRQSKFAVQTYRQIVSITRYETFTPEGLEEREETPELWTETAGEWETPREFWAKKARPGRLAKRQADKSPAELKAEALKAKQEALKLARERQALKKAEAEFYRLNPDLK